MWMRSTGQLVEFEGECHGEEGELVANGDEECDGEVVIVQDVDGALHIEGLVCLVEAFTSHKVKIVVTVF